MGTRETNSNPEADSPDRIPIAGEKDGIVEAALDEFSAAWIKGEAPDPERFCERFGERASKIRTRIDDFLFVVEGLGSRSWSEEAEARAASERITNQIVGSTLGDFRVMTEIGRGGMGVVYKAEQLSLSRFVALKVLSPHLGFSDDAVLKFRREAEAGGRQAHPGIVSVFAVGEHDGVHYIAQELVSGGRTLDDALCKYRDEAVLPLGYFRKMAKLLIEVADALSHAHSAEVIHRDVKPSNILIDPGGRPKVTDFGLAKIENALSLSRTGDLTGTPYYMSPEQAMSRRSEIDHRTDVYSLGVTLYETLTLEVPFDGDSSQEVLKKVLDQEPLDPRKRSARVPQDLAVIALKAMEKKPGRRYATMAEFADDLRRYVAGEPILARPNSALTKFVKRVKRNPAKSVAAIALVALLIASSVVYLLNSANKAERRHGIGLALVVQSKSALGSNPALALGLAIESTELAPTYQDKSALISALLALHERKTLFHDGPVASAAISPDSRLLATASGQTVRLFDTATGNELEIALRHAGEINCVRFSPDGRYLLTASEDRTARIWDVTTGDEKVLFEGHNDSVRSAEFSCDGKRVVTASKDMTVRIWDAESGNEVASFTGYQWWPCTASFSPDGNRIVTASEDGTARVWCVEGGILTQEIVLKHDGVVNAARFSPCGSFVVTASSDKTMAIDDTAIIWDIESKPARNVVTLARDNGANDAFFDQTGRRVAVALEDKTVRIYSARSGEEVAVLKGHDIGVRSVMWSNDSRMLATASSDGTARIWNDSPGQALVRIETDGEWEHFAFSNDGNAIARLSRDKKTIQICDLTRDQEPRYLRHDREVRPGAVFSLDRKRFATADYYNYVHVWDVDSEKVRDSRRMPGDVSSIDYLQGDSDWILCCGDTKAKILDVATREEIAVLDHEDKAHSAFFRKDGKTVLTVEQSGLLQIWSVSKEKVIKDIPTSLVTAFVDFDREGDRILLADHDGNVVIMEFGSDRSWQGNIGPEEEFSSITLRPGYDQVLVNKRSGRAMILEFYSEEWSDPCRHQSEIQSPVFSPNRRLLLTIPNEKTIAIRDLVDSKFLFEATFQKCIRQGMFNRDENGVIVSVEGGEVMLLPFDPLPVARLAMPRELTPFEREEYYIGDVGESGSDQESMHGGFLVRRGNVPASKPTERRRKLRESEFSVVGEMGDFYLLRDDDPGTSCMKFDDPAGTGEKICEFPNCEEKYRISIQPGGRRIFYCRKEGDGRFSYVVQDRDSGKENVISDGQQTWIEVRSWHPIEEIVYSRTAENADGPGGTAIVRLDISAQSNGKPRAILKRPGQFFGSFNVSPDGKQACFIHYPNHSEAFEQEVWIADLDPSGTILHNPRQLTSDCYADRDCHFSPDGTQIFWRGCEENGPTGIFRMNSDGTDKVTIFQGEPDTYIGDITVLGSGHIAYFTNRGSDRIIEIIDPNGNRVTSVGLDGRALSLPVECDRRASRWDRNR